MSSSALKLLAASGSKGDPVYVDDVFSTFLYKGNGSSQTITNGIDLAGEGGLTWFKARDDDTFNILFDTERGGTKWLNSASYNAEATASPAWVTYNSDGFTLPQAINGLNNTQEMVSWTFRKAPGFFDIVTYTGNGATSRTISHNLGVKPGMVIVKRTDTGGAGAGEWSVYHRGSPENTIPTPNQTKNLTLNTDGSISNNNVFGAHSAQTESIFTLGAANLPMINASGGTYVAYLFAHDAQDFGTDSDEAIIKCGSYTGNGSTDGPIIDLGFEPQWLLFKNTTANSDWSIYDVMRGITFRAGAGTGDDAYLNANSSAAEGAVGALNLAPNGFQLKGGVTSSNANGATHIYMAIRRPNKPAEEFAATDLYATAPQQAKVEGSLGGFRAGFVADFALKFEQTGAHNHDISCRLAAGRGMYTDSTSADAALSVATYDFQDGMGDQSQASTNNLRMLLRRAPGFFDVVAYTGTGSIRTQAHNLGVAPEMIWVKERSTSYYSWMVYHSGLNGGTTPERYAINLNSVGTKSANTGWWNNTAPTEAVFTLGGDNDVNRSAYPYIAYLFATASGISKVGHYTGTGNTLNIDCGFSTGARFILIKGETSQGDWYVWDSYRGIVAGNDPYLLLNSTAAQVTNTDYIDPLASGFTITSSAPAGINQVNSKYLFYAIA